MTTSGRRRGLRLLAAVGGVVSWGVGLGVERAEAHKPITSKYTYNEDVFPILRDRCGRCHVPDGVAPMSLMTYKDAYPWGESMRAEIIAGHMPPWHARDGAVRFKNAPTITAAEIDKILVWVSGGNPQGNLQNVPPPVALHHEWPMGTPDLVLQLPDATLATDKSEITQEVTIPTRTIESKWVRAVDLLPGTSSIVRNATISIKSTEQVLAVWVPGEDPVDAGGAAFQLPAGAELIVRVHYKKTYSYEGREMTDRSAVGLYFAEGPAREIRRFAVASAPVTATRDPLSFSRMVDEDLQVVAFTPDPSLSNARLQVDAVSAAGVRTPVMQLAVRPDWTRRYWFEQPLALSR
ncbi:MAG TPA: hypothetical protein VGJ39_14320, partial [Vicinamibacterales bacterium]